MEKNIWIETDYFDKFKCKCEKCKRCCCNGWVIPVSKKDYYKLLTMPCSKQLGEKINSCFVEPDFASEERYRVIAPNYLGNCPMLNEDGLCMIHLELGPEALSTVCKSYPRSYRKVNDTLLANCTNSCEAIIELLINEDKLTFKTSENFEKPNIIVNTKQDSSTLSLLFTLMIQDRTVPLNKRIQKIVEYLNGENDDTANSFDAFIQIMNFVSTVSINSQIYEEFKNELNNRYSLDEKGYLAYKKDEENFEHNVTKWMIYFENIIVNHLFYMDIPYVDERINIKDCSQGLCLLYGLMKLICSCCCIDDYSNQNLTYIISDIFHLVEHTPFYYNAHILIKNETSLLNI